MQHMTNMMNSITDHICHQIWQCVPVEAVWNLDLRPPPLGHGTAKCFSAETFTNIGLFNTGTII
jgi:hypothetical protein